jgi:hypothetical protein
VTNPPTTRRGLIWYVLKTPIGRVWVWILPLIICSQLATDMPQDIRAIGSTMMVLVIGLCISGYSTIRIYETRWARQEDLWEAPPCDMGDSKPAVKRVAPVKPVTTVIRDRGTPYG